MSSVLIIAGLVIIAAGIVVFLLPQPAPKPLPGPVAQSVTSDTAKLLEALSKMLEMFDKRYRPGMFLMFLGLAVMGLGVFLETRDVKDAAESAGLLILPGLLGAKAL